MNKKVIYTTIFGGYDNLVEPHFVPDGWDFVCFTDDDIESDQRVSENALSSLSIARRIASLTPIGFMLKTFNADSSRTTVE